MKRIHWSDCAINNGPALRAGPCDCGMLELALHAAEHGPVITSIALAGDRGGSFVM